ncbi:MAG: peptide chain release factor 1, partial [Nitrosarchaeum sp.]|nr:peptide chain release factor 1 [Nitrosarchaeum sp.]
EEIVERRDVIPKKTKFTNSPCPSCNSMEVEANEQDIVDYLELLTAKTGSRLEVVSGSAEHGVMLSSLGKVGAILRYNPGHAK